jgi:putative PIN family toxin of toxin-antitoxin system
VKVVIDTNVLVSGLLKRGTPPAEVLQDLLDGELVALYDERIIEEYREVLARPRLKIPPEQASAILDFIVAEGLAVANAKFEEPLPDPDDQPFADVAFTGSAEVLITGNAKHFPVAGPFRVVTPREWLDLKQPTSTNETLDAEE